MTGPAMFANGVPQLAALLAACAEGRAREVRDEVERHLARNPEDPRAGFLLRLITAAGPDYGAALKAIEEECNARDAQALAALTRGLESAKAELAKAGAEAARSRAELEEARAEAERVRAECERTRAAGEEETARLAAKQEQQAALIDKLAYVNEELERQQRELLASRWRRLGRRLGLAKRASFEA
ncbi:MAG TPA: hypothetical protein VKB42_18820 [Dongiaceae bacterium]|nr:hypothetical protein [Dongiaceae bacterium]